MEYQILKSLHILFASISIGGFTLRGILALRHSSQLQRRWLKVLPHINDTLLLSSAIGLAILAGYNPFQHPWLAAKIVLLIIYIGLGFLALRFARTPQAQRLFIGLAILVYAWMVGVAVSKSALIFF